MNEGQTQPQPVDLDAFDLYDLIGGEDKDDLIAELRAARKVVEKAAGVQRTAHGDPKILYSAVVQQWWVALTAALTALRAIREEVLQ